MASFKTPRGILRAKIALSPFYINYLDQPSKEFDFVITPSLVFSRVGRDDIKGRGYSYAISIKWGYRAIGIYVLGSYIFSEPTIESSSNPRETCPKCGAGNIKTKILDSFNVCGKCKTYWRKQS